MQYNEQKCRGGTYYHTSAPFQFIKGIIFWKQMIKNISIVWLSDAYMHDHHQNIFQQSQIGHCPALLIDHNIMVTISASQRRLFSHQQIINLFLAKFSNFNKKLLLLVVVWKYCSILRQKMNLYILLVICPIYIGV